MHVVGNYPQTKNSAIERGIAADSLSGMFQKVTRALQAMHMATAGLQYKTMLFKNLLHVIKVIQRAIIKMIVKLPLQNDCESESALVLTKNERQ